MALPKYTTTCDFFQRGSVATGVGKCSNAGLIIPSLPAQIAATDNTEVYCGTYLNPLNGQQSAGLVTGKFHSVGSQNKARRQDY
jgi:hypothetical protein